jgi:hypothetical protein
LKLERVSAGKGFIRDMENGRTLADLGFVNFEELTATKITSEEEIPKAPLVNPDRTLSEKFVEILEEWFILYSEIIPDSDGHRAMTKHTCSKFI